MATCGTCKWTLLLASLFLCGCGGLHTVPVAGTVVLASGEPLAHATVSMVAEDRSVSATGTTDAQGRFVMGTEGPSDGVPPGKFRAVVLPPISLDADAPTNAVFDPKYSKYETSPLVFTIEGAVDDLVIRLE